MSWLSVSFEMVASDVEAVTDALLAGGALSVDVSNADSGTAAERAVYAESGAELLRGWRRSLVSALVAEDADPAALLAAACARAGLVPPPHSVQRIAEQDWVRAMQSQFAPIRISPRLWIVPSWAAAPDPRAINIMLDPGLAFGTGGHATTRLCLRWLEHVIRGGESVIDYGCGSGILTIAAMKLGASSVAGVDIDPQALLAARRNAVQNRVDAIFHGAAEAVRQPAQIVVANILAHPLIVLAPLLAQLTAPGGRLALAGLLAEQIAGVGAAYREWFDLSAGEKEEGWVLLGGRRK